MKPYSQYRPTGFDCAGLGLREQQDWLVVGIGQNRDSGPLDRSNFECALRELGGESDDVEVHRFGHWACGWFELILVKPGSKAEQVGRELEASLEDYPILNESHFSELEQQEADEIWRNCYRPKDRLEYIRKNRNQFEFRSLSDALGCVRGKYFCGYASELVNR